MRHELEAFSTELEASGVDVSEVFDNDDTAKLEAAAAELANIPEAMATIRAARDAIKGKGGGRGRRGAAPKRGPALAISRRTLTSG